MLELHRGPLSLAVDPASGAFSLLRGRRALVRDARPWVRDGTAHDRFVALTEGVLAHEELEVPEAVARTEVLEQGPAEVVLGLVLDGGRPARLALALEDDASLAVRLEAHGAPLRVGVGWEGRADEHFAGLGARHVGRVDHAGARVQLGADRRYTGPDCPPDLRDLGGIPQGDYAPVPWLSSSRGYAVWCRTDGNGCRFDLGERSEVSVRSRTGPLELRVLGDRTPSARLRRFLRATGLPALQPEWAYGFWKSRDVYEHQDDVLDDLHGCRWHGIPLDAIVLDSPWETNYNTWVPNPGQFPDFPGLVARLRGAGVRTVVWVTPWVNVDSRDGQVPPDPLSRRLHAGPAPNHAEGVAAGHFVRDREGAPLVARWWMGDGSPVDFTSPAAGAWWREQARGVLQLGVEGVKADDGEGYYVPDDARLADGRSGAQAAWALGGLHRHSLQQVLDEVHGAGRGVVFGRSGWTGQGAVGVLWAGDQASDFWSLRVLVAAALSAAASGISNWSHDVGGYLGTRLVERCGPELLVRWAQLGCFTPLMQAHGRLVQEPWTYDPRTLARYRAAVLLHERLVPYVRAAAATAARAGLPIVRPLALLDAGDPRAWAVADAFGFGPSLWVAPVLEEGAREREAALPRGRWIETWTGDEVEGGGEVVVPAPLGRIPVWVRRGALVVTLPAEHVAAGLGVVPESERPLEATVWGEPPCGRARARLADGTELRWDARHGGRVTPEREVAWTVRP